MKRSHNQAYIQLSFPGQCSDVIPVPPYSDPITLQIQTASMKSSALSRRLRKGNPLEALDTDEVLLSGFWVCH
ncbi:unnamed protein product [Gongylonema pulchrum]|uniref:Uncharacterized protein n=1 Tax=Gongylonema pulchrum TaxID=637853 RepID=A0A183EHD8_9BILA|nr:unnamed protein product [Gongylonema pulchrum]